MKGPTLRLRTIVRIGAATVVQRPHLLLVWVLLSCATAPGSPGNTVGVEPEPITERAWVIFGTDSIHAEVARTEAQRERGLMLREVLPDDTGMLFVFPEAAVQGVWMKDTDLALDAAFIDESLTVLDVVPLEPRDLTVKYSDAPVLYVLEVPMGWFAEHGVTAGHRAAIEFGPPLIRR